MRRPAVQPGLTTVAELEAELRRNHDLITERPQGFPDDLFVRERAVRFGRIEESNAAFDGRVRRFTKRYKRYRADSDREGRRYKGDVVKELLYYARLRR